MAVGVFLCIVCYFLWINSKKDFQDETFLKDKNVLITGGSSGIGLALAKLFYSCGSNVILVARDLKKLDVTKDLLKNTCNGKGDIFIVSLDLNGEYNVLQQELNDLISRLGKFFII